MMHLCTILFSQNQSSSVNITFTGLELCSGCKAYLLPALNILRYALPILTMSMSNSYKVTSNNAIHTISYNKKDAFVSDDCVSAMWPPVTKRVFLFKSIFLCRGFNDNLGVIDALEIPYSLI